MNHVFLSLTAFSILVIHPYYKLNWIELHWGGAEAQAEAVLRGESNARNWVDEAEKLVESAERAQCIVVYLLY